MRVIHLTTIVAIGMASMLAGRMAQAEDVKDPQAASPSGDDKAAKDDRGPAPADAPVDASTAASITVIDSGNARAILGRDVRSRTDENMGRIADVIVDRGGQVRAAVIDFGGFLGVGSRKIAVAWKALRFSNVANKSESMSLELTRDQVKAAPEYKEDQPIIVLGASGRLEPIRFRPRATDN